MSRLDSTRTRLYGPLRLTTLLVGSAVLLSCGVGAAGNGDIAATGAAAGVGGDVSGGGSGAGTTGMGGSIGVGGAGGGFVPTEPADFVHLEDEPIGPSSMHRLTRSEVAHSLQDLFGEEVPIGELEPDNTVEGFASIGASSVSVSPAGVNLHEAAIRQATAHVVADATRMATAFPCQPEDANDSACLTEIVTRLGRRAFRRPLTETEISRFVGLATSIGSAEGSSMETGLRHALSALLQSPSFMYRIEQGVASPEDGGRLKYTAHEMASRLAGTFWDSLPDDELLDAADAGTLNSVEGVREHAARLIADPRSERAIAGFVDELFDLHRLHEAVKDPELFPTWTDSLKDAMAEELERRVLDMVFTRKGDFLALYDERTTFVNDELATFYGIPALGQPGFYHAEFPADSKRAGLLGAGAFLAGHSYPQRTSPTARGMFVVENILCQYVQPPPDNIPPLPAQTDATASMRERLAAHRISPACSGCHQIMDPIGLGMEDFDSVGLYRSMDGGKPVDATGVLEGPGYDGSPFDGLAQVGSVVRRQQVLGPCLVSKLYSEALGRHAVVPDRQAIRDLSSRFLGSENRVDQLLVELASSDSFRFVEPGGTP